MNLIQIIKSKPILLKNPKANSQELSMLQEEFKAFQAQIRQSQESQQRQQQVY